MDTDVDPGPRSVQAVTVCAECGFTYGGLTTAEIPNALVEIGTEFAGRLGRVPLDQLRRRPRPDVWSGLEYACHVRDVLLVQRDRLYIALVEDTPGFAKMNRDERVTLARYNDQDPADVAAQLSVAAQLAAQAFAALEDDHWLRPVIYNYPEPTRRTIGWMGEHTVHEGRHHLQDFDRSAGRGPAS
jgi:S-DNA-T family DNA segregation ATPase FtsK/SpoIIIE